MLPSDPMRPRSFARARIWWILALVAVLAPFLWLVAWPHEHPITSWIAVSFLVLVGLIAVFGGGTGRSRR